MRYSDKIGLTNEQLEEYDRVQKASKRWKAVQRVKNNIIQSRFNAQALVDIC